MKDQTGHVKSRLELETIRHNIIDWCHTLEQTRGLCLKQIAAGAGITYSALMQWRDGTVIPTTANLAAFARFCGIHIRCLHCNREDTRCVPCKSEKSIPCPHGYGTCYLPET